MSSAKKRKSFPVQYERDIPCTYYYIHASVRTLFKRSLILYLMHDAFSTIWNLEDMIYIKPAAFFILLPLLLPQFPERSCRYGLQHWQLIDKTPQQEAIFDEITFKQTLDIDTKSSLCCIPCVACMFQ